jgi:glycosyltransferase involved in cell wall biosynthesis
VDLHQPGYAESADDPGLWARLREFLRVQAGVIRVSGEYDALYVRSHFAAFPTVLYAKVREIPVVREVNGTYADLFIAWPWTRALAPLFRWVMRAQLRWSDTVIAVTEGLADWVRGEGAEGRIRVVSNAADVELFRSDRATETELPDRFVIFFGALAPWQGIETLLEAVHDPSWPEDVRLVVAGDGALRERVEEATADGKVLYIGTVPYRNLPGVVTASLAGLSPQGNLAGRGDTGLHPLKVFETMACGVPVIVTDHPGQADLVRSVDCGIVVPPEDPPALAGAVARLADDREAARAMGARGRRAAVERHSWKRRAEETAAVLSECLGEA